VTLLHACADVFPKGMPASLPPKRDIQHYTGLIPGAILLNKPAYRRNPKELVSKGVVPEPLCPCVVPALLGSPKSTIACVCVSTVKP